ncbi:MAG: TIGR04282 family arsenosugar biosynthesis glycosyltransferase [Planctomycetales bacterium]
MKRFGIFAKYWTPGAVKTRLAKVVGPLAASRIHLAFVECVIERLGRVADERILAFAPADRKREFAELAGERFDVAPQRGDDLGQRMEWFFQAAFADGAESVVLIGSDSPTLPVGYVEQAFDALQNTPVVLGPATDGGYYLVGARGKTPPIFSDMPWSEESLWDRTMDRLREHNTPCAVLPSWPDVDEYEDLSRLMDELNKADPVRDAAECALRERLAEILKPSPPDP